MTTVNFILRLDPLTAAKADAAAEAANLSRNQWISDLITGTLANEPDPGLMLGYWQVQSSEFAADDECITCSQPIGLRPWVGTTAAGKIVGPLCAQCAS